MRKSSLAIFSIFLCFTYMAESRAQTSILGLDCDRCRNPYFFPRDYRNFAFNQLVGPDGWMTMAQADFFRVENPNGHVVLVDINIDVEMFTLDLGLPLTLPYPVGLTLQIILNLENGDQIKYMLDPRAYPNGLPVGRKRIGGGGGGGTGGGPSAPPATGAPSPGSGTVCGTTQVDNGKKRRTCL